MREYNYDTYCGLYCGACSILKAYQSGIKDPFACMFSDELGLELKCHGCKTDQVFENCAKCPIRPCAREKGVEHCPDCPDFPCPKHGFARFMLEKLPHWATAAVNLENIQEHGVESWLKEQEAQWKCPDCHTDYTWYDTYCSTCGKDLGDIKPYKNSFDKSIFQMITMPGPDEMSKKEIVYKLEGIDQVRIQKDIVYSSISGSEQRLDLYSPPEPLPDQKPPLVVLVHGETREASIKDSEVYASIGKVIASSGMIAASFNHRMLLQGFQIKDVIGDIENLIDFLIDHADKYGINENRIAVWAFSGGVPFGLSAGLHSPSPSIKCLAAYYGFGDFTSLLQLLNGAVAYEGMIEQAEEYSPLKLLNQAKDKTVPILVARAGLDQIPNLLDSLDSFIAAALAHNVHIDVYNHPTGVHAFDLFNDEPRTHEIIEKTLEFLKRHLSDL